jgi:hypothetical protein
MIDLQHNMFVVECDSCPEVLQTHTKNFQEARETMKREGWKIRKIADVWVHGCPNCGVPT